MMELKYSPDKGNPDRELETVVRGISAIIEVMIPYAYGKPEDYTSRQIWPLLHILIKPVLNHFLDDGFIEYPVDKDSEDVFIEEPVEIEPFIPRKIKSKEEIKAFFDAMETFCKKTGTEQVFSREEMQDFEDFFWWLKKEEEHFSG
jgi:hypothetical protein